MLQPTEILAEIKSRPPLQRKSAEESYRGIKVNWKLTFKDAHRRNTNLLIHAWPENSLYPDVDFEVNKDAYPHFNILHDGELFWVKGKISELTMYKIQLIDCEVKFSDESESQNVEQPSTGSTFVNSQIHYGNGDNVIGKKTMAVERSFWSSLVGQVIVGLSVTAIVAIFTYILNK